jgi:hypothetical protein
MLVSIVMVLDLLILSALHIAEGRRVNDNAAKKVGKHYSWSVNYGACTASCGDGEEPVTRLRCKERKRLLKDVVVPKHFCGSEEAPGPRPCKAMHSCEWRVGEILRTEEDDFLGQAPAECGFKEVECWSPDGGGKITEKAFCTEKGEGDKNFPSETEFRAEYGMTTQGCAASMLASVCIISVNYPSDLRPPDGVNEQKDPKNVTEKCEGTPDIIVLATQELTSSKRITSFGVDQIVPWSDRFPEYREKAATLSGYEVVASCGGKISTGVIVLVHESKRHLVAPMQEPLNPGARGDCFDLKGNDGANTNVKGTVVGAIRTVQGMLAFASTHGTRGDTVSEGRLAEVKDAAEHLLRLRPEFIAWAGDFNPRTEGLQHDHTALAAGTTHPPDYKRDTTDLHEHYSDIYNPETAYERIKQLPDTFAVRGETTSQTIARISDSSIVEVPGVRDLCPSYPKRVKMGRTKTRSSSNGDHTVWMPNWACQCPTCDKVEYYPSSLEGAVKWDGKKNRSPSYPDRIFVSPNLKCSPITKVLSDADHDTLVVTCVLPQI